MLVNTRRGALRHWLIGCGIFILLLIAIMVGSGYFLYKKIAPKTFDTASKVDPPKDASQDLLLPLESGGYTRKSVGKMDPTATDPVAASFIRAEYENPAGDGATVMVVSTEAQQQGARQRMGKKEDPMANLSQTPSNMGFAMKIPFGPKSEMAVWAKTNWTYMIQTTSTSAMSFAEKFMPGEADAETSAPKSSEETPAAKE